jgi:zinc D-Ala-D-Ala dipeptidase
MTKRWLAPLLLSLCLAAGPAHAQTAPPHEEGRFRPPDLVELLALDASLRLDIRYASANNFTGRPVYPEARALLQRPAAEALLRAHRALGAHGYGLLIFDGYRPWSITKLFWEVSPDRAFVADPAKGSKHNRGCAVDLSLFDRATGREVEMPGGYDEMSPRSSPDFAGGTPEQRARRDLLRRLMEREGFSVEANEWWHFNYKDWREYPLLDLPFSAIATRR